MRLVDRRIGIGGRAGIRVGDADAPEAGATDDFRSLRGWQRRVKERVEFGRVPVRPAIDRDRRDVCGRIKAAGT